MRRTLEVYEDFYGCTYTVLRMPDDKHRLVARTPSGKLFYAKSYDTRHGCMVGLGRLTEGTKRLVGKKELT